ncbi:2OG-Fe(II) oxygenase [Acetobacteraceae bacterium KSS8]|uniref:2OG-Fe(II) oxygenase n=1 Tax=Endosaccharibacter trunci TaxID=2812733 RepID=A0ABT1WAQ4_9PROT|nr:2OG-Fe(II) oxygenase [Acetobacteraceae bacterium KSS8]
MSSFATLLTGDPAPWFRQRCTTPQGDYTFDMAAGRFVLLFLFDSAASSDAQAGLEAIAARRSLFDDKDGSFFGVSADPADEGRLRAELPGIRFFQDADGLVGRLYGSRPLDGGGPGRAIWFLLDRSLRVIAATLDAPGAASRMIGSLEIALQREGAATEWPAPALVLPDVFEPEFCSRLIDYYDKQGGTPSGVFTQRGDAPSHAVTDTRFKRRSDCPVRDRSLVEQIQARIVRRVVPAIRSAFQFEATQLERLILASYDSAELGCFGPHRDNTVSATAHRKFAVSINLNDGFQGGELVFPEFGRRRYRPGAGGAVIFSCSLMHQVTPVTAGRRLACLPFVYDEAGAVIKRANRAEVATPAGS